MTTIVNEINVFEDRISSYYSDLQNFKSKIKERRQMLKDAYENDADYAEKMEEVKAKKRELARIKEKLNNEPAIQVIKSDIDQLKDEVKDTQLGLFANLDSYCTQMKATSIEINGDILHIKKNFQLVKKP